MIVIEGTCWTSLDRGAEIRVRKMSGRVAVSGFSFVSAGREEKSPDATKGCSRSRKGPLSISTSATLVAALVQTSWRASYERSDSVV